MLFRSCGTKFALHQAHASLPRAAVAFAGERAKCQLKIVFNRDKREFMQFHAFYGFVAIIAIAIIYSYRAQLKSRVYLLYGFGGLFLMGLSIRAMLVGQAA